MRIDRPFGELQMHLGFVKESLHQIEAELKGFAGHLDFLHEAFIGRLNDYNLVAAKKDAAYPLENSLFVIQKPGSRPIKHHVLYSTIDGWRFTANRSASNRPTGSPRTWKIKGLRVSEKI